MSAVQDLSSFRLPPGFRGRSAVYVQLWFLVQATLFAMSPRFMFAWRRLILRLFGARVGKNVQIRPGARILYPWRVSIGDFSWIGDGSNIYSLAEITIGDNVAIAADVSIISGSHDYTKPSFPIVATPVQIARQAWICDRVTILPGVSIGEGSIVGAASLVLEDTEPLSINAGHPARKIGYRVTDA